MANDALKAIISTIKADAQKIAANADTAMAAVNALDVVVTTKLATTTTLTASPNPSTSGQEVTFTATVKPVSGSGVPSGTVRLWTGSTELVSAALANGIALFKIATLPLGNHTRAVTYDGDTAFSASASTTLTQVVNAVVTGGSGRKLWGTNFTEAVTFGSPTFSNSNYCTVPVNFAGNPFPAEFAANAPYLFLLANPGTTLSANNVASYFKYSIVGNAMRQQIVAPAGVAQHQTDMQQMGWWCNPVAAFGKNRTIYIRSKILWPADMWTRELTKGQTNGTWTNWKVLWEYKTGSSLSPPGNNDGDFRGIITALNTTPQMWTAAVDANAGGGLTVPGAWVDQNKSATPPPVGTPFTFEVVLNHGKFIKAAVNGKLVMDSAGRTAIGSKGMSINRFWLTQLYAGFVNGGATQDVSAMEIWVDGVPSDATISPPA